MEFWAILTTQAVYVLQLSLISNAESGLLFYTLKDYLILPQTVKIFPTNLTSSFSNLN